MTEIETTRLEHPTVRWYPFCGSNTCCPCMEPDSNGPCGEFVENPNPRCGRCGWPEYRHITPVGSSE